MYQAEFVATNSEDWAEAIEFYDATGAGQITDLIPADASFELVVRRDGTPVLTAKTEDNTLLRPTPEILQWRFPMSRMRSLAPGIVYAIGLTMSTPTGTEQILVGTLSFFDGIVK